MWFLILAVDADFLSEFSEPPSFIRIFTSTFFCLRGRLCLLISHISAQDGERRRDEKGSHLPLSCPPPILLLSLSSAPYGAAKLSRRLSRLPRSLHRNHTGRGVWEVAVAQCVSQCLLTFISICHEPSYSESMDVDLALVLGGINACGCL